MKQKKFIIRKVQIQYRDTETFKTDPTQLNVKVSEERLCQCFGRIQGGPLIFIPKESVLAEN